MGLTKYRPSLPKVIDEADRATRYPSPKDGQQVFNKRINITETYNDFYGLWLSDNVEPMVRQTTIVNVLLNRIVRIQGSFGVGGDSVPVAVYPTNNGNDDTSIGLVVEIGKAANAVTDYIGVATKGKYFVEYAPSVIISAGEFIFPKVQGANSDQGYAISQISPFGGSCGAAYQNSGADPTMGNKVLFKIEMTR